MFFDCGHKSESRPQKEERRKKVKLTWDIQRCWTLCSLEERNGWKPPHFFHQSLLISFFFFHNNVKMASSQYLTQHPASLSLDLTKMKVCVSPQVGVAMETTIIQCSRQWLLNKRELSDGIKEQAWFLFPCNMCWQHQQPSRGGRMGGLHYIKHIKTAHSVLFPAHNGGTKCFVSQTSE